MPHNLRAVSALDEWHREGSEKRRKSWPSSRDLRRPPVTLPRLTGSAACCTDDGHTRGSASQSSAMLGGGGTTMMWALSQGREADRVGCRSRPRAVTAVAVRVPRGGQLQKPVLMDPASRPMASKVRGVDSSDLNVTRKPSRTLALTARKWAMAVAPRAPVARKLILRVTSRPAGKTGDVSDRHLRPNRRAWRRLQIALGNDVARNFGRPSFPTSGRCRPTHGSAAKALTRADPRDPSRGVPGHGGVDGWRMVGAAGIDALRHRLWEGVLGERLSLGGVALTMRTQQGQQGHHVDEARKLPAPKLSVL